MSSTISTDDFRKASGLWATGVAIVTTAGRDGKPYGLTMNSVTSLSLDPPLYIVNVDNNSDTLSPMLDSGAYCINVLATGQDDLSNRFAKKGEGKFVDVDYESGLGGAPKIAGTLMTIECSINAVHDGGDHKIVVGKVEHITTADADTTRPLLYYRGRYAAVE